MTLKFFDESAWWVEPYLWSIPIKWFVHTIEPRYSDFIIKNGREVATKYTLTVKFGLPRFKRRKCVVRCEDES